jgi:hypothetical protein
MNGKLERESNVILSLPWSRMVYKVQLRIRLQQSCNWGSATAKFPAAGCSLHLSGEGIILAHVSRTLLRTMSPTPGSTPHQLCACVILEYDKRALVSLFGCTRLKIEMGRNMMKGFER